MSADFESQLKETLCALCRKAELIDDEIVSRQVQEAVKTAFAENNRLPVSGKCLFKKPPHPQCPIGLAQR